MEFKNIEKQYEKAKINPNFLKVNLLILMKKKKNGETISDKLSICSNGTMFEK